MTYCKTCGLYYHTPIKHCIFCNNILETKENTEHEDYNYPPVQKHRRVKATLQKIINFILVVAVLACVIINLFYGNGHATDSSLTMGLFSRLSWSIYVVFSCILASLITHNFLTSSTVFHKIYMTLLDTCIYLVAISILGKDTSWAFNYVLPFGLLALNILSTCCIFGNRIRLFRYSIYVFATSLLALIPILLYFLSITTVGWPSLSCSLYGLLTLFGLFFFSTKESKEELKRRLHC